MTTAQDIFQKMATKKFFSKLDLTKRYWQIPMAAKDISKTAFVTPDGTYEFLKMPFGMVSSGATLVRSLRKLLGNMENVDNYVDNIVVHTQTWEEHMTALKDLFQRLSKAKLTARPTKCVLGSNSVDIVGHCVTEGIKGLQI